MVENLYIQIISRADIEGKREEKTKLPSPRAGSFACCVCYMVFFSAVVFFCAICHAARYLRMHSGFLRLISR